MRKLQPADWKRNVPAGMKALDQWVGWATSQGRPKTPKKLVDGKNAKANDPSTWGKWDDACRWYERHQRDPTRGCGFIFRKGDGLVFIDVDDCLGEQERKGSDAVDPNALKDWARPLIEPLLKFCYAEKSPGGKGLHLFLIASFPAGCTRSGATWKVDPKDKLRRDSIALFDDRRLSTVTGDVYENCRTLMPAQAQLDALLDKLPELRRKLSAPGADEEEREEREVTPEVIEDVKKALDATDPDLPHDQWVKVGMALKSGLGDTGFQLWDSWSARGSKYKGGETRAKWASFQSDGVGLGSVFFVAEEEGGFNLRTSAEDDFKSFKNVDGISPSERYEKGSLVKWQELGLHLKARGSGKNVTVLPSEGDANVGMYLENHERWKGQLRFNERTCEPEVLDGEPLDLHELTRHVVNFMNWGRSPSEDTVQRAALAVAKKSSYDPVREWLRGLEWDGKARVDGLCSQLGLEDTEMTRRQLRRWMIGCVARAFKPGCKFQTMLVLHGAQGKKKSTFFERLAFRREWYSESEVDMTSKDGQLALLGPWIVENAELDGMTRADVSRVKVFVGESVSRFREPYARKTQPHPRRCGLGGSTNETEFLRDPTGARRFHLIGVLPDTELRVDMLDESFVTSLWAEAKAAYQRKERWWDEGDEVREVLEANEAHYEGTALDGYVQAVLVELRLRAVTTVQEVTLRLADKYRVPPTTRSREIAGAMQRAGWKRLVLRVAGTQRRFWTAPAAQPDFLQKAAEQAHARVEETEFKEEEA